MDTLFEHIALASIEEARRPLLPLHAGQTSVPPPEPEEPPPEPVPYADEADVDDGVVFFSSRVVRSARLRSPRTGVTTGVSDCRRAVSPVSSHRPASPETTSFPT